jgi:PKD repeat protein
MPRVSSLGCGVVVVILFVSVFIPGASALQSGLRIVVIAGEDAVNIIQQKTAVAPVVEVRDRNDLPIAGVPVTFAITGQNAAFAGGLQQLTIVTNAAGRAVVSGLTPLASGPVQIGVTATYQGQTAAIALTQTNVLTAAQTTAAAGAGSGAGGGSGGGVSTGTVAGIGGAAAGAAVAAAALTGGEDPAAPALAITASPAGAGVRDVTAFTFTATAGGAANPTFAWDFGDGTTASGNPVTHVFAAEGTFSVRVDEQTGRETATQTVTVGSLTGTWSTDRQNCNDPTRTCPIVYRLIITQQGSALSGRWEQDYDPTWPTVPSVIPDVQPLSGSVAAPREITISQEGQCQRLLTTTTVNADFRAFNATMIARSPTCVVGGGPQQLTFRRQ